MSNIFELVQKLKAMNAQDSFDVYQMTMQMATSTSGVSEKMLSIVTEEAKLRRAEWASHGLRSLHKEPTAPLTSLEIIMSQ